MANICFCCSFCDTSLKFVFRFDSSLMLHVSQGNEYFQRKSYLTALREYNVSVLSAPSADVTSVDSMCQHSAPESNGVTDGKQESVISSSAGNETTKMLDDDAENKSPDVVAKDESASDVEQKSSGDGVKEDKASNKNELALAFANRSWSHYAVLINYYDSC